MLASEWFGKTETTWVLTDSKRLTETPGDPTDGLLTESLILSCSSGVSSQNTPPLSLLYARLCPLTDCFCDSGKEPTSRGGGSYRGGLLPLRDSPSELKQT
ncbi:hypothetical protein CgunFtcFv8_025219 [Champsocephalus gunnari]|uniref:Uncharacterized protein n=1 Tax=Champsocephalus gunnari TaxID=52237 RepID=A0AAN8H2N5_CHAGU|nr:hypothetical protein CgunFtcFv8_025219 [Champsocephalus gunnari]